MRGLPSSFAALRWSRRCCCRSACSRGRQPAPPGNCWRAWAFERPWTSAFWGVPGPEAQETMKALKTAGISIGGRSKIRMLVGDRAHLESAEWRNCCGRIRPRSRWVMPLRNVVPQAPQTRPLWTRAVLNLPAVVWCSGRRWPGYKKSTRRGAAPSRQIRTHSSGSGTRALGTLCWLRGLKMTSPPCGLELPRRH